MLRVLLSLDARARKPGMFPCAPFFTRMTSRAVTMAPAFVREAQRRNCKVIAAQLFSTREEIDEYLGKVLSRLVVQFPMLESCPASAQSFWGPGGEWRR